MSVSVKGLTDKNTFKSRAPDRGIKAYTYL